MPILPEHSAVLKAVEINNSFRFCLFTIARLNFSNSLNNPIKVINEHSNGHPSLAALLSSE